MTHKPCPDCGEPMTLVRVRCPDDNPGCLVLHRELACAPCRQRQWEEHDRPATIGELAELSRRLDRLEAAGNGDAALGAIDD